MAHTTALRDTVVAGSAGGLAPVGLLIAGVLIGEFVLQNSTIDDVLADEELMVQAVTMDLQFNGGFPEDVQVRYDAIPDGDTISDALWEEMVLAASPHLGALSEDERIGLTEQFTGFAFAQVGLLGRVSAQMGPFDLLWVFLAVSTAWGTMKQEQEPATVTV